MGYYLSEGSTTKISKNSYRVKISQQIHLDKFYKDISKLPFKFTKTKEAVNCYYKELGKDLIKYGHSYQKYVPKIIKTFTKEKIELFLEAYILGDGHTYSPKSWKEKCSYKKFKVISTSSKKMADDIGELILKCGGRPSYAFKNAKGKSVKFKNGTYKINHHQWQIAWAHTIHSMTEKLIKKEINYNDNVYCVELEKWHTLFVRRNGKVAWSGNCRSSTTPIVKSVRELPESMRSEQILTSAALAAALTGAIPQRTSYLQWLKRQPASIQEEVLGTVRYNLWKDGELEIEGFYSRDARFYTLTELQNLGVQIPEEYLRYVNGDV